MDSRAYVANPVEVLGLGLFEVVLSIGLVGLLATSVAPIFSLSARSLVLARQRTSALIYATDRIEQFRIGARQTGILLPQVGQTEVDYLDGAGGRLGVGGEPPSGALYQRVTSVRTLARQTDVVVVRVVVDPTRTGVSNDRGVTVSLGGATLETLVQWGREGKR
jgi:type II secretory pathway pseudopilin PulG